MCICFGFSGALVLDIKGFGVGRMGWGEWEFRRREGRDVFTRWFRFS